MQRGPFKIWTWWTEFKSSVDNNYTTSASSVYKKYRHNTPVAINWFGSVYKWKGIYFLLLQTHILIPAEKKGKLKKKKGNEDTQERQNI